MKKFFFYYILFLIFYIIQFRSFHLLKKNMLAYLKIFLGLFKFDFSFSKFLFNHVCKGLLINEYATRHCTKLKNLRVVTDLNGEGMQFVYKMCKIWSV